MLSPSREFQDFDATLPNIVGECVYATCSTAKDTGRKA